MNTPTWFATTPNSQTLVCPTLWILSHIQVNHGSGHWREQFYSGPWQNDIGRTCTCPLKLAIDSIHPLSSLLPQWFFFKHSHVLQKKLQESVISACIKLASLSITVSFSHGTVCTWAVLMLSSCTYLSFSHWVWFSINTISSEYFTSSAIDLTSRPVHICP